MSHHKDHLLVAGVCVAMLAVIVFVLSFSYRQVEGSGNPVSYTVLEQGAMSGVNKRANYLITNQEQFDALWEMLHGASSTPPAVAFNREQVIVVFLGDAPTGGYGIAVDSVRDQEHVRDVELKVSWPDTSCFVSQGVTTPYQVVVVPTTVLPLAHHDDLEKVGCSN